MERLEIIEATKKFFDAELEEVKSILEYKPDWLTDPDRMIDNTIHECLGVAQFVQVLDVSYQEVDPYFTEVRKELKKLKKGVDR
jgi:hypothetical protein